MIDRIISIDTMVKTIALAAIWYCFCPLTGMAQLNISAQLRARTEVRDGQGTLSVRGAIPAAFTSQRTRLNVNYIGTRIKFGLVAQDVRVWGQDASTINRTSADLRDGLMMHEAWAELTLLDTGSVIDNLSLKIGRQELVYDDSRLLGNLDWLQQARRHDVALLKFAEGNWLAHMGFAFNQNGEFASGNIYNGVPIGNAYAAGTNGIGAMYKSFQFLYTNRKLKNGNYSFLLLKDDFNRYSVGSNSPSRVLEQGVWSRYTTGLTIARTKQPMSFHVSAFYQGGTNKDGISLHAWMATLLASYQFSPKIIVSAGADFTSGNEPSIINKDARFDPLYGTPHKFWGTMDYFYVASGFGAIGLTDYALKWKHISSSKLSWGVDIHEFYSANTILDGNGNKISRRLGTEVDVLMNHNITKQITFELGYSAMFATSTLASPTIKNIVNADLQANWIYVMISLKPELFND